MERNGVLTRPVTSRLHILIIPSARHCSHTPCVISSQLISVMLFLRNIMRETDLSCIVVPSWKLSLPVHVHMFSLPVPLLFGILAHHCHSRIIPDISADDNVILCNENICVYICATIWSLTRLPGLCWILDTHKCPVERRAVPTQFNGREEVKMPYTASEYGDLVKRHLVSKWQIRLIYPLKAGIKKRF